MGIPTPRIIQETNLAVRRNVADFSGASRASRLATMSQ